MLRETGKRLAIEEAPDPKPGFGEAVVRVKAVGICHSDLEIIEGKIPLPKPPPFILGHEVAGVVEVVGAGVTHLKPGDRVALLGFGEPAVGVGIAWKDARTYMRIR